MGSVMIQNYTCKNPITMIGFEAGICWGADTADEKKNYRRGLDCLESGHGRTFEFPDVYLTLEGYSAREMCIRDSVRSPSGRRAASPACPRRISRCCSSGSDNRNNSRRGPHVF